MPRIKERAPITSVWSAYGHIFMSSDVDASGVSQESCLTCGAMYQLSPVPGDWTRGEYTAADGSEPMECSRDTSMAHGYPDEREGGNVDHDCNCILCDS